MTFRSTPNVREQKVLDFFPKVHMGRKLQLENEERESTTPHWPIFFPHLYAQALSNTLAIYSQVQKKKKKTLAIESHHCHLSEQNAISGEPHSGDLSPAKSFLRSTLYFLSLLSKTNIKKRAAQPWPPPSRLSLISSLFFLVLGNKHPVGWGSAEVRLRVNLGWAGEVRLVND